MIILKKTALMAGMVGLLAVSTVAEARPYRAKVVGQNGSIAKTSGAYGTTTRARGARQNADGSVTAASGRTLRTATGAAARGSTTTVNPDGSATRSGRLAAGGARGSVNSNSNVTRNADGNYSGGRTTSATRASTGNSYKGSTQIDPATGKPVRTATCTDAAGNVISCPR
jgi:hypothetical protein